MNSIVYFHLDMCFAKRFLFKNKVSQSDEWHIATHLYLHLSAEIGIRLDDYFIGLGFGFPSTLVGEWRWNGVSASKEGT